MQIRAATESDLGKVEKLFSLPELAEANGEYCSAEILADYIDEKFFLVAEDAGGIIGALFGERLKGAGMLLWVFAIEEGMRGKGVGTALLTNFENNMALENRTWIMLYAPAQSPKTIRFYENRGYQKGKPQIEFLKCFNQ
ncbi:MAG: GNAT family N-acetyltransferase [Parcubacteria group bacterium]